MEINYNVLKIHLLIMHVQVDLIFDESHGQWSLNDHIISIWI